MKIFRKELWFEVPTRRAFIKVTPASLCRHLLIVRKQVRCAKSENS